MAALFSVRAVAAAKALPLVLVLAWPAQAFSQADQPSAQPAAQLQALNEAARAAYAAGREELLSRHGPVIIVGSDVVLLAHGTEARASYTPQSYTTLKALAHITLGTVGLLQAHLDDPAAGAAEWRPPLEALRAEARAVEPVLGALGLGDEAEARSRFMVGRLLALMDGALERGTYTREELTDAARDVTPYLLASADEAAADQIDLLHAVVEGWRQGMSEAEWDGLRVLVLGPRMPRDGFLQFEYFRFALGEDAVDDRLIYAENVFDEEGALSLLGTILADRSIASITFEDGMRMDRDLLADGAQAHLLQLFGRLGRPYPLEANIAAGPGLGESPPPEADSPSAAPPTSTP